MASPSRVPRRPRRTQVVLPILWIVLVSFFFAVSDPKALGQAVASPTDSEPVVTVPPPTPEDTPPPGARIVNVSSIRSLLATLSDDTVDVIVVANGTYHVSPSNKTVGDSLWIGGDQYASRTRPILVQAETRGGVTFDGGGDNDYAGLTFLDGAHHQTWDGFVFANMRADHSGIVEFGGYVPQRPPHHITMRFITIKRTCRGQATNMDAPATEHAFYISNAKGVGPNNLLFEDITVDGRGGLASAFQFDHGDAANPNASNLVVRRLRVTSTQQAIILWEPTLHNITFDDVTITDPLRYAIRYETIGATGILLSNITSTGSGDQPFFSSMGSHPPGLTLKNVNLH